MKIRHILFRDLRILLSDKKTLAIILLMPIILTSILSFALSGAFGDNPEVPEFEVSVVRNYEQVSASEALVNVMSDNLIGSLMPEDIKRDLINTASDTDMEKIFFEDFLGHEDISSMMTYTIEDEETAYSRLKNNETSAIIILPENFLTASYTNMFTTYQSKLEIEVIRNPERSVTPSIAVSIVNGFMDRMASSNIRKNIAIESFLAADIASGDMDDDKIVENLIESSFTQDFEVTFIDETATGRTAISSKGYYSVSMLTLFLLFSAGRGSYMLLEEKRDFTYQRMLTAGVSKWQILAGKFFVVFSIVVIQLIALILYSTYVLGVNWGSPLELSVISIFTAFAVAGLGSLLAVVTFISDKTRIASLFESVIFQVMGLIGGAYIPVEILPKEIQSISKLPLNGVALKAYLSIMTGSGLDELSNSLLLLALNGIVFAAAAVYLMGMKGETKHVGSDQAQVAGA